MTCVTKSGLGAGPTKVVIWGAITYPCPTRSQNPSLHMRSLAAEAFLTVPLKMLVTHVNMCTTSIRMRVPSTLMEALNKVDWNLKQFLYNLRISNIT